MTQQTIAVILIRSIIGVRPDVRATLDDLRLKKRNAMSFIMDNPSNRGMLRVVKDYVTWGILDDETKKILIEKKGDKKDYNLNSPQKGYGKKGIKKPFVSGGALGDRKEKINDLIVRMM